MGAYSPLPWADPKLVDEVMETVLQPTVDELRRRGTPFSGLLYAGLAITSRGVRVIEFNARFGDPETQVVLARLKTPLAGVLLGSANGTLDDLPPLRWRDDAAVTVVIASHNYPDTPRTGDPIHGPRRGGGAGRPARVRPARRDQARRRRDRQRGRPRAVRDRDRQGPRQARERAYTAVARIRLDGSQHRTDIAREGGRSLSRPALCIAPPQARGPRGRGMSPDVPAGCPSAFALWTPVRQPPLPKAIPSSDGCAHPADGRRGPN